MRDIAVGAGCASIAAFSRAVSGVAGAYHAYSGYRARVQPDGPFCDTRPEQLIV